MRKLVTLIVLALIPALTLSMRTFGSIQSSAQDKHAVVRLSGYDVLKIIANPLPEGSSKGYYLPNADIHNLNLIGVNFRSALLSYSDLSESILLNADLSNASLQEVNLSNVELSNANLSNTWLLASNLEGATIAYSTLDGANLEDVNLRNADLTGSRLVNVNLKGADITNASFEGAIMSSVTLPNGNKYKEGDDLISDFGAKSNP